MRRSCTVTILAAVLLSLCTGITGAADQPLYSPDFSREMIRRQINRYKKAARYKLFSIYNIKKGMTILDIGAGSGQTAYLIAEKHKESVTVFATDIDPAMVDYMKKTSKTTEFKQCISRPCGQKRF